MCGASLFSINHSQINQYTVWLNLLNCNLLLTCMGIYIYPHNLRDHILTASSNRSGESRQMLSTLLLMPEIQTWSNIYYEVYHNTFVLLLTLVSRGSVIMSCFYRACRGASCESDYNTLPTCLEKALTLRCRIYIIHISAYIISICFPF